MNKGVLVWGYLSSFILLLGAIFDNKGLIAGKVLFLVGFLAFNLGYLIPLFYVIFQENQENKIGIFLLFGILGFFIFLTGISFFAVNWGGGIVLIYVGGAILILAIIIMILLSRRFYETSIYSWFPVLVFGVFIVVSLITSMVNRQVMRVFNLNNYHSNEIIINTQKQNDLLYNSLVHLDTVVVGNKEIIDQAKLIYSQAGELDKYITHLKVDLVAKVEGEKLKVFEGEVLDNLFHIQSNVEINSVKRFMLKKERRASELKKRLAAYKVYLKGALPIEKHYLANALDSYLTLESCQLSGRRYEKNWEMQNFYELPLVAVVNQLTTIQERVVVTEKEFLNYLFIQSLLMQNENLMTKDSAFVGNK